MSKNVFDFVIRTRRRPKIATKDTLLQLFLKMSKTRYTGVAHKVVVFFSGASFLIIELMEMLHVLHTVVYKKRIASMSLVWHMDLDGITFISPLYLG